jgi:hypothetical protein
MKSEIKLFEERKVRTVWNEDTEEWYFSIVDVVGILTESPDPKRYWSVLKTRVKREINEGTTICSTLKMLAADGKMRMTDVADVEQLFRLIQSVPSPKAEPFKMWLAQLGRERLEEIDDPELGIERLMEYYHRAGYSDAWINQRIKSIEIRKGLTDEWDRAGVKQGDEYALLTDLMTKTWSGMTTKEYRQHKNLKKENLRDNMTNLELVINMLAEATTTELSARHSPQGVYQSSVVARKGSEVAKHARLEIEKQGGQVISSQNAIGLGKRKKQEMLPESDTSNNEE